MVYRWEEENLAEEAKVKDIILTPKKEQRIVFSIRRELVEMEICANLSMVGEMLFLKIRGKRNPEGIKQRRF